MLGVPLNAPHMDTSMFYEDCAWMPEYPGVPIGDEEGRLIHEALGTKRSILLGHHGQLAACATMEEATMLGLFIERAAKLQLMAMAAGTIRDVKPECIREAHDYRLKKKYVDAVFCYYSRRVLKNPTRCWSSQSQPTNKGGVDMNLKRLAVAATFPFAALAAGPAARPPGSPPSRSRSSSPPAPAARPTRWRG